MKMYIMRHSEATHNAEGYLNSDPRQPIGLTSDGMAQAKDLAEQLNNVHFTKIYVSELPRTQQTADFINTNHGAPIVVEPLLNESKTGFDGCPAQDWLDFLDTTTDGWRDAYGDSESRADVFERCQKFFHGVVTKNEDVAVVTHGFLVESLRTIAQGDAPGDIRGLYTKQGEFYTCLV